MEGINKEIMVSRKKFLKYEVHDGFVPFHIIIAEDITEDPKSIKFCKWDDYSIKSWSALENYDSQIIKREVHCFEKKHPLYIPLLHLLNGQEELVIDDDETPEINQKYMRIYFCDGIIKIEFINNLEDEHQVFERFSIFIKNIFFDLRSKIDVDGKDIKERLYFFFEEVYSLFDEEYHQMSIEEYLLKKDALDLNESKKYVRKMTKTIWIINDKKYKCY